MTEAKKKALPYFPMGFTQFGAELVASGFETAEEIYLAVWNLANNGREVNIPLDGHKIKEAKLQLGKKEKVIKLIPYGFCKLRLTVINKMQ